MRISYAQKTLYTYPDNSTKGMSMKKHRLNTTISARHWELLKKYANKFETQQKALESALESLDNNSKQIHTLSPEDELLLRAVKDMKTTIPIPKDLYKVLLKSMYIERIEAELKDVNSGKYFTTWYYQKPLKKCSLEEILNSIVLFFKSGNIADSVDYIDKYDYYSLRFIHSLKLNHSKLLKIMIEALFEEYGARIESEIADDGIFMKIFKNQ